MSKISGVWQTPGGIRHFPKARLTAAEREERRRAIARKKIRQFKPFREWVNERPRSAEDCQLYRMVLRGLAEVVAGKHDGPRVLVSRRRVSRT